MLMFKKYNFKRTLKTLGTNIYTHYCALSEVLFVCAYYVRCYEPDKTFSCTAHYSSDYKRYIMLPTAGPYSRLLEQQYTNKSQQKNSNNNHDKLLRILNSFVVLSHRLYQRCKIILCPLVMHFVLCPTRNFWLQLKAHVIKLLKLYSIKDIQNETTQITIIPKTKTKNYENDLLLSASNITVVPYYSLVVHERKMSSRAVTPLNDIKSRVFDTSRTSTIASSSASTIEPTEILLSDDYYDGEESLEGQYNYNANYDDLINEWKSCYSETMATKLRNKYKLTEKLGFKKSLPQYDSTTQIKKLDYMEKRLQLLADVLSKTLCSKPYQKGKEQQADN